MFSLESDENFVSGETIIYRDILLTRDPLCDSIVTGESLLKEKEEEVFDGHSDDEIHLDRVSAVVSGFTGNWNCSVP